MKCLVLISLLVGLIIIAGCAQQPEKPVESPAAKPIATADEGKNLYFIKGCSKCHGANGEGTLGTAPALKGLYGSQVELVDGTKVIANEAFILESIQKPEAKVVKGFSAMPDLGVTDEDAEALLLYIKILK